MLSKAAGGSVTAGCRHCAGRVRVDRVQSGSLRSLAGLGEANADPFLGEPGIRFPASLAWALNYNLDVRLEETVWTLHSKIRERLCLTLAAEKPASRRWRGEGRFRWRLRTGLSEVSWREPAPLPAAQPPGRLLPESAGFSLSPCILHVVSVLQVSPQCFKMSLSFPCHVTPFILVQLTASPPAQGAQAGDGRPCQLFPASSSLLPFLAPYPPSRLSSVQLLLLVPCSPLSQVHLLICWKHSWDLATCSCC